MGREKKNRKEEKDTNKILVLITALVQLISATITLVGKLIE